jgi:photosystem II stability/assembly factor-like uncharacterized protein
MKGKLHLLFVCLAPFAVIFALIPGPIAAGKTRTARRPPIKQVGHKCRGRMMTREQIAATRGLSVKEFNQILSAGLLTPEEVCTVSARVLNRAKEKAKAPRPDRPDEALLYRLLDLRDERGNIPDDGYERARRHNQRMKDEQRGQGQGKKMAGLVVNAEQTSPEGIQPLAAGIEPSQWTWIGPGNIGGRIRAILIHPTTPSRMWVGGVSGGIWTTVNGGTSWSPVNDFMANLAVTSLIISPANTNVLYAGTGEGFNNSDGIRGAGIFKSADGGVTWAQLASTANSNFYFVNRLAISPNGGTLLAATGSGIFRSGDEGGSWTQMTTTRTLDIDFHPTDNAQAIAGLANGTGMYSVNGGVSWTATSSFGGGRVEVAYARNAPNTVYASVENASGELWRSADAGHTFKRVSTGVNYLGSQGWYDNALWVDPTNSQIVIVGGIDLWRSTNGGSTLTKISQWQSAPNSAHADNHGMAPHPGFDGVSNRTVFFVNDGGVYRASNVYTVTPTSGWQELNNNLGITQFYGASGNVSTGTIVGGTQDNGTLRYQTSTGTEGWTTMFGGDGGWSASDPTNSNYFYGEYVYLRIHRSTNGGASSSNIYNGITDAANSCANFIAPFILDPNNPNTMLGGACSLWRSTNVKATTPTWSAIKAPISGNSRISAVAVAKGNSNIVWVGHNNGDVYTTDNGTASSPTWFLVGAVLPNRKVTRIAIDPNNPDIVYATFGGFSPDNVWRTDDGGATWADITGVGSTGLPDAPVRSLVIHPQNSDWLYVGTEVGVFASEDGGQTWGLPHDGPANVSVDELFWMGTTLVAATHGRGLFSVPVAGGGPVTVFYEGAESASTTFVASSSTSTTVWTRNQTSVYQGAWRWRAGSSTGGNYGNGGDARLTTPTLNLSNASTVTLSYAFKHSTESGLDSFQVQISTDGGANWTNLLNASGQSANWNGWAPLQNINLNAYAGQTNVRIRFRLVTNGSVTDWGAAIDEVSVVKQ